MARQSDWRANPPRQAPRDSPQTADFGVRRTAWRKMFAPKGRLPILSASNPAKGGTEGGKLDPAVVLYMGPELICGDGARCSGCIMFLPARGGILQGGAGKCSILDPPEVEADGVCGLYVGARVPQDSASGTSTRRGETELARPAGNGGLMRLAACPATLSFRGPTVSVGPRNLSERSLSPANSGGARDDSRLLPSGQTPYPAQLRTGLVPAEVAGYIPPRRSGGGTKCGTCQYFLADAEAPQNSVDAKVPGACEKVAGRVEAGGCCNAWQRRGEANASEVQVATGRL